MCGICGIVYADSERPVSRDVLMRMRDVMAHRGPDDQGIFLDGNVGLGHRRLSILDLSERGHQPMGTPDGRLWIVYNGEIYNFKELRYWLEGRGKQFRSDTDTEVLLYLYELEGPTMLDRLNGMFAFAIWDCQEQTLFAARDRLGIKPFYYTIQDGAFFFASEEKALFAAGLRPEFDHTTWEELLCFRYVAGERTPYAGIERLLPGHYLLVCHGETRIFRWWTLVEHVEGDGQDTDSDSEMAFRDLFDDAVALRRISDVPVGVLLSGGVDSSSIAASLAKQAGRGVASFTVRFDDDMYDEGAISRQVVERWGLERHELVIRPDEYLPLLRRAAWYHDEPLAHGHDLHILAISQYAKPRVTVLLSGEGADETMAGYVRYQLLRFARALNWVRPAAPVFSRLNRINHRVRKLGDFLSLGSDDLVVLYNSCDALPQHLELLGLKAQPRFPFRQAVLDEALRFTNDRVKQVMYYDLHTFLCSLLDRNDRMTMGASIECRVPFLDYRLVQSAFARSTAEYFGQRQGKWLLRRAMRDRLPEAVLRHRKWGFGVPWPKYLREIEELRQFVLSIPDTQPVVCSPLDIGRVRRLLTEFLAGDDTYSFLVLELVMITVWYEECVNVWFNDANLSAPSARFAERGGQHPRI